MKNTHIFLLLLFIIAFTSCMRLVKVTGWIKNPKVENQASIEKLIDKMDLGEENNYILSVNNPDSLTEDDFNYNLFFGQGEIIVYDSSGTRYCYKGKSHCTGTHLRNYADSMDKYFLPCKENDTIWTSNFKEVVTHLRTLDNKTVSFSDLPKTKYYMIYGWCNWMQTKKQRREDYEWVKETIEGMDVTVTLLKVNTDLNEHWGLTKKDKLKAKMKKSKGSGYELTLE